MLSQLSAGEIAERFTRARPLGSIHKLQRNIGLKWLLALRSAPGAQGQLLMIFLVARANAIASSVSIPNRVEVLETVVGVLFIAGLCVVGAGLPILH
jgi:hypothetical protein